MSSTHFVCITECTSSSLPFIPLSLLGRVNNKRHTIHAVLAFKNAMRSCLSFGCNGDERVAREGRS